MGKKKKHKSDKSKKSDRGKRALRRAESQQPEACPGRFYRCCFLLFLLHAVDALVTFQVLCSPKRKKESSRTFGLKARLDNHTRMALALHAMRMVPVTQGFWWFTCVTQDFLPIDSFSCFRHDGLAEVWLRLSRQRSFQSQGALST
jgi:hypothetical protein